MFFSQKNTIIFLNFSSIYIFTRNLIIDYRSSKRLSLKWNLGSFLGFLIIFQILTGILLLLYYVPREKESFLTVDFITRERIFGFSFRAFHLNGASLIFLFAYFHILRGICFFRFRLIFVWIIGRIILLLLIVTAFLGYVLPIGQISFWGATVITNLIRVIPYIGTDFVLWIWGGFSINKSRLNLFFILHFIVPFLLLVLIFFHLFFLHSTRRTRLLFVHERYRKVKFFPFYIYKDLINILIILILFALCLFAPWIFGDPENWIKANPIISPIHIKPEWYFLFAYAILRCIPRKLGGVIALVLRVIIFFFLRINKNYKNKINFFRKIFFVLFIFSFVILTWLGGCQVESPFIELSQIFRIIYFLRFFVFIL